MVTSNKRESITTALAATSALGSTASGKQIGRLAAAIESAPELRKCVECGTMTAGSVGAAGIKWPMLCQSCKDTADAAALMSARRHARVADAIFRDDGDAFPGSLPLPVEPFDGVTPADGGGL